MKQVGARREAPIAAQASGAALISGARFSESVARLTGIGFAPKGVYRFKSHEAANRHDEVVLPAPWRDWLHNALEY